jgi:3-carboxy-cis,cis-muconate cycloisomerase
MAHKRNPTLSIAARAAALRAPHLLATLFAAQDQEHERAAGALPAEAATWPTFMLCASLALSAMAEALPGLIIQPDNMLRNLGFLDTSDIPPAVPGLIARALDAHNNFENRLRT